MERPQAGPGPRQRAGSGRGRTTLTPTSRARHWPGEDVRPRRLLGHGDRLPRFSRAAAPVTSTTRPARARRRRWRRRDASSVPRTRPSGRGAAGCRHGRGPAPPPAPAPTGAAGPRWDGTACDGATPPRPKACQSEATVLGAIDPRPRAGRDRDRRGRCRSAATAQAACISAPLRPPRPGHLRDPDLAQRRSSAPSEAARTRAAMKSVMVRPCVVARGMFRRGKRT